MITTILGFFSCACSDLPAPRSTAIVVRKDTPHLTTFSLYFIRYEGCLRQKNESVFVGPGNGEPNEPIDNARPSSSQNTRESYQLDWPEAMGP